jgi:hypothetical protein
LGLCIWVRIQEVKIRVPIKKKTEEIKCFELPDVLLEGYKLESPSKRLGIKINSVEVYKILVQISKLLTPKKEMMKTSAAQTTNPPRKTRKTESSMSRVQIQLSRLELFTLQTV